MRRFFGYISLYLMTCFSILSGIVIETAHFNEITKHIHSDTLIILDIDDTLLIPTQTLGTDVWFRYRMTQHEGLGLTHTQAVEKALAEWEAIRHLTQVKMVEEGSEKMIEELQTQKFVVMGLTTQGLALATRTIQQLQSLNIDLSKTAPSKEDDYFLNDLGVLYRQGILFTSGTHKGNALLKLLDRIGYHPKHIVFINDKASHLIEVERALELRGIDFIGLRYSYSDERVNNFRPDIANFQWKNSTFEHLLSDQDVEALLIGK